MGRVLHELEFRPISDLNEEVKELITIELQKGVSERIAAHLAGIEYGTFRRWYDEGAEDSPLRSINHELWYKFFVFRKEVNHAKAYVIGDTEKQIVQSIREGDICSAKWWLERRSPQEWAQREKVELTAGDFEKAADSNQQLSLDDKRKRIKELRDMRSSLVPIAQLTKSDPDIIDAEFTEEHE